MDSTYSALSSLGAPVTLNEFTQIYKGPLADILDFFGEHLVGRRGAATARSQILSLQSTSNLKQPRTDADRAVARLGSASKACEVYGGELDERLTKSEATQAKLDSLGRELARKKRVLLLLGVIEAKERVRIGRVEELGRRIAGEQSTVRRVALEPKGVKQLVLPAPRVSNVKDCLATLHSLSIRKTPPEDEATRRLRAVVTRRFDDADVERIMNQCVSFARGKSSPRRDSLEARMKLSEEKARELQTLVDLWTMLQRLCESYVASRKEFVQSISPALGQSLRENTCSAKGYMDVLRAAIVTPGTETTEESFPILIARLCRMHGSVPVRAILNEVEHVIKRSHRRYSLTAIGQRLPQPVAVSKNPIGGDRSSAHERSTAVLSRKADKAVKGRLLADEVEAVLRDSRRVVGIGERNKD
ncbi:hypothetical protein FB45DRAFT_1062262 [Roridomyces roridus]|uniref:Uncharacterized protein n=1 Tax=Roridomyces roridus TaxID=1738132 RepID=A0AAD7BI47_9AGAR|nr:hypothetical protein FB45DRAFT_1062262 [Roridomyces roridus]